MSNVQIRVREIGRKRDGDRQTDRQTDREGQTNRQTINAQGRGRDKQTETDNEQAKQSLDNWWNDNHWYQHCPSVPSLWPVWSSGQKSRCQTPRSHRYMPCRSLRTRSLQPVSELPSSRPWRGEWTPGGRSLKDLLWGRSEARCFPRLPPLTTTLICLSYNVSFDKPILKPDKFRI